MQSSSGYSPLSRGFGTTVARLVSHCAVRIHIRCLHRPAVSRDQPCDPAWHCGPATTRFVAVGPYRQERRITPVLATGALTGVSRVGPEPRGPAKSPGEHFSAALRARVVARMRWDVGGRTVLSCASPSLSTRSIRALICFMTEPLRECRYFDRAFPLRLPAPDRNSEEL